MTGRARCHLPADREWRLQSNPDTSYLLTPVSLKFGSLITFSGKMPTFPKTLPASKTGARRSTNRYWSLCSGSSPVTGLGYDRVYDQQVPLNKNAGTRSCRPGQGSSGQRETGLRDTAGSTSARARITTTRPPATGSTPCTCFMAVDRPGKQAPESGEDPGTEKVMGPYFPTSKYTTKAAFRKLG